MRHHLLASAVTTATVLCFAGSANAQVQVGDIVAAVIETGEVHIITGGGDFTGAVPFASIAPELAYTLCISPDGTVLLASIGENGMGGSVYDITSGTPVVFATGFSRPATIACEARNIFVADVDQGIFDITAGGDFTNATPIVTGINPVGLFRTAGGAIYASHNSLGPISPTEFGIFNVTARGDFQGTLPFAKSDDGFLGTILRYEGNLLVPEFGIGRITTFTNGGDLTAAPTFGTLAGVNGLVAAEGSLYAGTDIGEVYDVSAGGMQTGTTPFATNLGGVVYGMAHHGCGNGITDAPEQCDGAGETITCNLDCTATFCGDNVINATAGEFCEENGIESATCDDDCTPPDCGDGNHNAAAGEACDDGFDTATCDDDCTLPLCGDGKMNTAAGENCDDGNVDDGDGCDSNCQVEQGGNGGGGAVGGAGGAGAGAVAVASVGTGGNASSGSGNIDETLNGGGCGCTTAPAQSDGWKLLPLLGLGLLARRRRRS